MLQTFKAMPFCLFRTWWRLWNSKETGRLKKGIFQGTKNCRHPRLVFLPAKLRHLGCRVALGWLMRKIPNQINGDALAAYFSKYGCVETVTPLKSSDGTAHGDYILMVCLDKKGFLGIPPYHFLWATINNGCHQWHEAALLDLETVMPHSMDLTSSDGCH